MIMMMIMTIIMYITSCLFNWVINVNNKC